MEFTPYVASNLGCITDGQRRAKVAIWQNVWKRRYIAEMKEGNYTGIVDSEVSNLYDLKDITSMLDKYGLPTERKKNDKKSYSVTINPPVTDDWEEDLKKLRKFIAHLFTLVSFPPYVAYAYDQRSSDPNNIYGIHVHMLVEVTELYPSDLISKIHNCMKGKKHYGNKVDRSCIHVKFCNESWLDYVKGEKGTEKQDVVDVTNIMFQKAGIMKYFDQENTELF